MLPSRCKACILYKLKLLIQIIMKSIILMSVYLGSFILLYLMLSLIGAFFNPYSEVVTNDSWFIVYTVLIGWWMSIFPAREYYAMNEDYFERVF